MRTLIWLPPLALLAACSPTGGGPGGTPDSDGNGLGDSWEQERDLDPDSDDTDGDGYSDYDEVWGHTDPSDAADRPYVGGWERGPIPDGLADAGVGGEVGRVAPDFELTDQHGDSVRLWSFYGKVLLVESGAEWCGPCQQAAAEAEGEYQEFKDRGFLMISLLGEDSSNQPATQETVSRWADNYGLTFPVLADANWSASSPLEKDNGIPSFHLVGRDMVLRVVDGTPSHSDIEAALADEVPQVPWDEPPTLDAAAGDDDDSAAPLTAATAPFGAALYPSQDHSPPPYGGASCSQQGATRGGWLALLLPLLARRRRSS